MSLEQLAMVHNYNIEKRPRDFPSDETLELIVYERMARMTMTYLAHIHVFCHLVALYIGTKLVNFY